MAEKESKAKSAEQTYACELPPGCPPTDATSPKNVTLFRALKGTEPTAEDFLSHRELYPEKKFSDECQCRGLSLSDTLEGIERVLKFPIFRNGTVGTLVLRSDSGVVKQTGAKGHFTWWRFASFDAVANCTAHSGKEESS